MDDEIARLERTAERLGGEERETVLQMIRILQAEKRQIGPAIDKEMEYDQAMVIKSLNDIELQVKELEMEMPSRLERHAFTTGEAEEIVNRFFVACQIAEDAIKGAYARGNISSTQMEELNDQLRTLVRRMFALSKRSEPLLDAILCALEAKIVI